MYGTKRTHVHQWFTALILVLAFAVTVFTPTPALADLVNPNGKLRFKQYHKGTITRSYPKRKEVEVSESSYSYAVTRNESGYTVTAVQESTSLKSDGEVVKAPVLEMLIGFPMTITLDANARATGISGPERALAALRDRVGEKTFTDMYSPFISADKVGRGIMDDWNKMVWISPALEAKAGFTATVTYEARVPEGGPIGVGVPVKVTGLRNVGARKCITVERKAEIKTPDLLAAYKRYYDKVGIRYESISITLNDWYLIDTDTGLVLESKERRTTRHRSAIDDEKAINATEEEYTEKRISL